MTQSTGSERRRGHRAARLGHRLLSLAVMAGWVAMPLVPVLAYAFSRLKGVG